MPSDKMPIKTMILPAFCLRVSETRNSPKSNMSRISVIGKNKGANNFLSKNIQIISVHELLTEKFSQQAPNIL
jgi:hypothetical protein